MTLEQALRLLSGFFLGIWVARHLGPEAFGVLSLGLAVTALLRGPAKLGLDTILVRELTTEPDISKKILVLKTGFLLKLISGSVIFLLSLATLLNLNHDERQLSLLICLASLIFISTEVGQFYLESEVDLAKISQLKIGVLFLTSFLKLLFIIWGVGVVWFAALFLLEACLISFGILCLLRRQLKAFLGARWWDRSLAVRLISDSWPLIFTSMSVFLFSSSDKLMISFFLGDSALGVYAAGIKFTSSASLFPTVLCTVFFPAILSAKQISQEKYASQLSQLYSTVSWIGISLAIIFIVSSDFLILLFGPDYEAAKTVLIIASISLPLTFQWIARGRWVVAENLQYLTMRFMIIGATFNITLNAVAIPAVGIEGAAWSTFMTLFMVTYILPLTSKATRGSVKALLMSVIVPKFNEA